MTDIDEDYEGDLGPLLADLAALRSALGNSYQEFGHLHPDTDDDWLVHQQTPQFLPSGTAPQAGAAPTTAPRTILRSEPAPLPERLAAVASALEANQSLQQRLRRLITSVNRAQDQAIGIRDRVRAAQRRKQVAASAPHALSARRRDQDQITGVSWYWSQPGAPAPPPYPGFSDIQSVIEVLPLVFPRRKWQEDERNALCDGVVQVVQERLLNKILADLESTTPVAGVDADGGGAGGGVSAGISLEEFEARQAPIRDLTASSPQVIEIAATLTDAEWATVAHRSVHGRTAKECSLQWINAAQPTINHEEFTAEEDTLLMNLVDQYGTRSWPRVAVELQRQQQNSLLPPPPPPPPPLPKSVTATTNNPNTTSSGNGNRAALNNKQRTPLACMARYQKLLHTNRDTQEFTPADRERLIQIVNRVGVQWKRVAEEFGGPWDFDQLMHQWRRYAQRHEGGDGTTSAAVVPRRGKWLPEEDEALLTAVALYGKKWSHVAKLVPGRSDVQCRERYANCLDPGVNKEPWSVQEDDLLRDNIERFTDAATGRVKWARIAELIPGRTDYAAKKRWTALTSGQSRGGGRGGFGARGGGARAQERGRQTAYGNGNGNSAAAGGGGDGDTVDITRFNDEGAGTSAAAAAGAGAAAAGSKKKAPARRKKQKIQSTQTAEDIEIMQPTEVPPPLPPPPPPPPVVEEPEAVPIVTRTGRSLSKPSRLAD